MAIRRYAGNKFVGLSTDTKPVTAPDGSTLYESDAFKSYVKASGVWTELESTKAVSSRTDVDSIKVIVGTAGEALSHCDAVYLYNDSGTPKYKKAQCDGTLSEANAVGIVTQSGGISSGTSGEITLAGSITNNSWTWTAGPIYISSIYGGLTQTQPTTAGHYVRPIGFATSTTTLYIFPQPLWVVISSGWSVSHVSDTKTYDADAVSIDTLADTLGTLINALKAQGILGA